MAALVVMVGLGACNQVGEERGPYAGGVSYPWQDRLDPPGSNPYANGRQYAWQGVRAASVLGPQAVPGGDNYLSDVTYTSATNSWGPIEKDRSNGEQGAGDGRPLTLNGQTYTKGLGVHAHSELVYTLTTPCTAFTASVGVDDEVGSRGSVIFQVYGDGRLLYDSGRLTGASPTQAVQVDLSGVGTLRLVVTDGGDNIDYDHADWADAKVSCAPPPPPSTTSFLSDLGTLAASNGWGPFEKDRSNGEQLSGDGRPLTLNGQTYTKGLGVHAHSSLRYALGGNCTAFTASVGVDDEVGSRGSVIFQVYTDGTLAYQSPLLTGASPTQAVQVDVSGKQELRLVVTDGGDNIDYDHADWADAKVTCSGASPAPTTYTYTSIARQPYGVSEAQGEAVGGKLYVFGGFDSLKACCTPTDRVNVYDPASNTWSALPVMPGRGATHAGMTTDGTDIYYAGGYVANSSWTGQVFGTRAVWRYNVASRTYTRLPDLPATSAAGQLEYLGGRLHYFGGTTPDRTRDLGDHYVLDLASGASSWTVAAPLPQPRQHMGSAVLGGLIYAIGGQTGHDANLVTQAAVHAYDPATDTWRALAPLPRARSHISNSTFVLGGRIVVAGGETSHDQAIRDVIAYDPSTNSWTALTPLPEARVSGVAGGIGNNFFFTGGNSSASGWRAAPSTP